MKTFITLRKFGDYSYIYICFTRQGQKLRINTRLQAGQSEINKTGFFKPSVSKSKEKNEIITDLRERVEAYINDRISRDKPLSQSECQKYILSPETKQRVEQKRAEATRKPDTNLFLSHYFNFLRERQKELNITQSTIVTYNSLETALKAFQEHNNKPLTLEYFNDRSNIIQFKSFLSSDRKLCDNTLCKRLTALRTYMRWLGDSNIFQYNSNVFSIRQGKYQKEIISLSRAELQQIINIKTDNEAWQRVLDVFVCNCFLGLRVSDLMTLDRGEFKQDSDGDFLYIKENIKTGITVNIPITEIALRILQKYNFSLPTYASQYFNRELHKILKHYKLFEYPVTHIRKVQRENQNTTYLKRELITSHTCRKTFITLAVSNNIPLNVIMKASGHRQINTLSSYVELVTDKNEFKRLCS